MKFPLCFALGLMLTSLHAQNVITPGPTKPAGIKVGLTGGPGLAFQHYYYKGSDSLMLGFADYWNKLHKSKTGFNLGLCFQLPLSPSGYVDAGIVYAEKSYQVISSGNVFWPDTTHAPQPQDPKTIKSLYKKHFVDIPIHVGTSIGTGRLRWTIGAGVVNHIFLNERYTQVIVQNNGNKVKTHRYEEEDYHLLNVSGSLKIGVEYVASDRLRLQLTPSFQYGLFEIIDMPVTAKIHHAGLNFTCYYECGKTKVRT